MGREARTLLIVGVMGVISVVTLMWLANRYSRVLDQRRETSSEARKGPQPPRHTATLNLPVAVEVPDVTPDEQALAYVDAFLAVRAAVSAALEGATDAGPAERLKLLASERTAALERFELAESDYRQVRTLWRGWQADRTAPTQPFERAFTARAERLDAADLGPMEAYD